MKRLEVRVRRQTVN